MIIILTIGGIVFLAGLILTAYEVKNAIDYDNKDYL